MPTPTTTNRGYQKPDPLNYLDEDVLRLVAALDAIDVDVASLFSSMSGKASVTHSHVINDVTGLQAALDGKLSTSATFALDALTDVEVAAANDNMFLRKVGGVWIGVSLDGSMIASGTIPAARLGTHTHAISDVTGLQAAIDGKAALVHTHAIADVTNLQSSLNAKADASAVVGRQTIYVPADSMTIRTSNGPARNSVELTTNKVMMSSLDFDTSAQEFAQFSVKMPKSWNAGTVFFRAVWTHGAASTPFGVAWQLQGMALSDNNAGDTAYGTAVVVTDTGGTANQLYISPESGAITLGNTPAKGDWCSFQVARVPANASDTLAVDAKLLGIELIYVTDAATDV